MILIIKNRDKEEYKILQLSRRAQNNECRISDVLAKGQCLDNFVMRQSFYKSTINSLIQRGFNIQPFRQGGNSNYHHDQIVQFMEREQLAVCQVIFDPDDFRRLKLLDDLNNLDL